MPNFEQETIANIIAEQGPMGVNALAMELGVPASSLQRYLTAQDYFRKTSDRRWDLPGNVNSEVKSNTLALMVDNAITGNKLVHASVQEIIEQVEILTKTLTIVKRNVHNITNNNPPVADERFATLEKDSETLKEAIKRNKANINPELYDQVLRFDFIGMILDRGKPATRNFLDTVLTPIVLGDIDSIDDPNYELLKEFQK